MKPNWTEEEKRVATAQLERMEIEKLSTTDDALWKTAIELALQRNRLRSVLGRFQWRVYEGHPCFCMDFSTAQRGHTRTCLKAREALKAVEGEG